VGQQRVYDIDVLPSRIVLDSEELVTAHLRNAQSVRTVRSEVILDVNHAGRWIRGIELLGGINFNLEAAVKPFNPRRPLSGESGGATYDEEADASFIYFSMKAPVAHLPETALKYSHSITPMAELALDSDGGLVWLRFSPRDANQSPADFVSLIKAPIEK
jgi:hypothetical protein